MDENFDYHKESAFVFGRKIDYCMNPEVVAFYTLSSTNNMRFPHCFSRDRMQVVLDLKQSVWD